MQYPKILQKKYRYLWYLLFYKKFKNYNKSIIMRLNFYNLQLMAWAGAALIVNSGARDVKNRAAVQL